jgi:acyl-CoA oxidase
VRGIQTTATYDQLTDEFIINTPDDTAMKFWIGGAAKSATVSAVFANLIINGKNEGPHVFIVPLRDKKTYNVLPGIIIGDCGKKLGQESIDNGFILFNNFRIPRENMLNKMSNVTREGKFETSIPSPDQRLALILGGISQGRLLIIGFSPRIIGYGLKIALRFAAMRRQFGKPGDKEEISLIEYPLHQYRLFPYLGNVIA